MTKASIYIITFVADGRVYIGQTRRKRHVGAVARWNDHVSTAMSGRTKTHFHNAIRKYGKEAFSFDVLEVCDADQANDRERHYIAAYKSNLKEFGFNMSEGGDGGQNSMSEEVRARIAASKRGVPTGPCSPEKAKRISEAKLAQGLRHSDETRRLIGENRKVERLSEVWKLNISAGLLKTAQYKLSTEEVLKVESLLPSMTDAELAKAFNVSRKMIWRIRNNRHQHPGFRGKGGSQLQQFQEQS